MPTVIIDDVLSGLDNTTEKPVFDRIFGRNGILRKSRTTVILATHLTHWARQADKVVTSSKQGTYQELLARNIDPQVFNAEANAEANAEGSNAEGNPIDERPGPAETDRSGPSTKADLSSDDGGDDDTYDRRSGDIHCLLYFLSAIGKWHCSIYFMLLVLITASTTLQCELFYPVDYIFMLNILRICG